MERKMLVFFILGLLITGVPLAVQNYILSKQISEVRHEISLKDQEISKLKAEVQEVSGDFDLLKQFIQKCDSNLISEMSRAVRKDIHVVFAISIEFSHELSANDIQEMNSIGVGFVKIDGSIAHKGEIYLASASLNAILEASRRDDVIKIEYGFSREIGGFQGGTYYAGAFANVAEYAEVSVVPDTISLGEWLTINVKNTHPTKRMAFVLIVYHELEDGSQVEMFSTARPPPPGMTDWPPYTFLDPGSTYTIRFQPEDSGHYFVTPNHVSFMVAEA